MHEEALLRDLKRKVEEVARGNRATRVNRVGIWVGALAHISDDQLRARWNEITQGGAAEGASLEIHRSRDPEDPRAQSIVLTRVDVDRDDPPLPERGDLAEHP